MSDEIEVMPKSSYMSLIPFRKMRFRDDSRVYIGMSVPAIIITAVLFIFGLLMMGYFVLAFYRPDIVKSWWHNNTANPISIFLGLLSIFGGYLMLKHFRKSSFFNKKTRIFKNNWT